MNQTEESEEIASSSTSNNNSKDNHGLEIAPSLSDPRLFTDKYYPKSLKDLDYNFELNKELINLAKVKDLPHLMFCGIPGSGKKTRAMLFLRERFGPSIMRVKKKEVSFKYSNKPIEFQLLYSNYHYQIDPSIHGVYDRSIMQDLVKKIMQLQLGITDMSVGSHKVIVVENADRLTQEAQQSLRRTLELYVKSCRFIFLVNNEGNMIEPLQSRCLKLRVPAPTNSDIRNILENISTNENIEISDKSMDYLIRYSDKNLNTLINQLQILNLKSPGRLADPKGISVKEISDIHAHVKMMVDTIFTGTNLGILTTIRQYIYDLLVNCVTPTEIIKLIFEEVLTRIPDSGFKYKYEIIKIAKKYDHTIRLGSKPIYHIEAMVVHLFNMIKMIQQRISSTSASSKTANPGSNPGSNPNSQKEESPKAKKVPAKRGPKLKQVSPPIVSSTTSTATSTSYSANASTISATVTTASIIATPSSNELIIAKPSEKIKIKVKPKLML